jgi:2-polyprenyl-3-methyl-5-hydroxy-6-metoxy-1,4-benzoquinol methylase
MATPREIVVHGRTFERFSRVEIHPRVASLLALHPRGKVLDFPAGSGALSWRLHGEGFEVIAADARVDSFANPEIRIVEADLNQRFPFEDASFDAACFLEGPEHVENVFHCFREFRRVIKPGGVLIISLPNYSNIESRLKSLVFGASEPVLSVPEHGKFASFPGALHINRLTYAAMATALELAGFRVTGVHRDRVKWKQQLLWPLAWAIMLASGLRSRSRTRYRTSESNQAAVLMGGNTLIITAA